MTITLPYGNGLVALGNESGSTVGCTLEEPILSNQAWFFIFGARPLSNTAPVPGGFNFSYNLQIRNSSGVVIGNPAPAWVNRRMIIASASPPIKSRYMSYYFGVADKESGRNYPTGTRFEVDFAVHPTGELYPHRAVCAVFALDGDFGADPYSVFNNGAQGLFAGETWNDYDVFGWGTTSPISAVWDSSDTIVAPEASAMGGIILNGFTNSWPSGQFGPPGSWMYLLTLQDNFEGEYIGLYPIFRYNPILGVGSTYAFDSDPIAATSFPDPLRWGMQVSAFTETGKWLKKYGPGIRV